MGQEQESAAAEVERLTALRDTAEKGSAPDAGRGARP
jgi:hypothetical protein